MTIIASGQLSQHPRLRAAGTATALTHAHLRSADRACCCSARPSVIAVMPPAPGRPQSIELLFCRHHYRESQSHLAAMGAMIFDSLGGFLAPDDDVLA
jgi:hypothetical protein